MGGGIDQLIQRQLVGLGAQLRQILPQHFSFGHDALRGGAQLRQVDGPLRDRSGSIGGSIQCGRQAGAGLLRGQLRGQRSDVGGSRGQIGQDRRHLGRGDQVAAVIQQASRRRGQSLRVSRRQKRLRCGDHTVDLRAQGVQIGGSACDIGSRRVEGGQCLFDRRGQRGAVEGCDKSADICSRGCRVGKDRRQFRTADEFSSTFQRLTCKAGQGLRVF